MCLVYWGVWDGWDYVNHRTNELTTLYMCVYYVYAMDYSSMPT